MTSPFTLPLLSPAHFAILGLDVLAYVKEISENGSPRFAIHAANGRRLCVLEDRAAAVALVEINDMQPLSLQ
jgi:hypothetical protein